MRRGFIALGLIACSLACTTIYLWRELGVERAQSAELRAQLAARKTVAASVATNTAPAPAPSPEAPLPAPSPPAPTANAEPAAPARVVGRQEDWEAFQRRMMRDPRYREIQREQSRLTYAPRRANLIRLLGLTPEQADAVIDLQIEREWQQAELQAPVNAEQGQQRQKLVEAQEAEYQSKLGKMLGEQKREGLEHYMETRQTRMQVDAFRTQLSNADSLRDDQIEPLIDALHAERSKMWEQLVEYRNTLELEGPSTETSQRRMEERQAELLQTMQSDMHTAAAAILSRSQLQQLDVMLQRERLRHEAQQRMNQIQSKLD